MWHHSYQATYQYRRRSKEESKSMHTKLNALSAEPQWKRVLFKSNQFEPYIKFTASSIQIEPVPLCFLFGSQICVYSYRHIECHTSLPCPDSLVTHMAKIRWRPTTPTTPSLFRTVTWLLAALRVFNQITEEANQPSLLSSSFFLPSHSRLRRHWSLSVYFFPLKETLTHFQQVRFAQNILVTPCSLREQKFLH